MKPLWNISLCVLTTVLTGCATKPACCQKAEVPGAFTDKSLYQVESSWTTDANKQIKFSELSGRPRVVTMFFSKCQFVCPYLVNDMKRIEAALPPQVRSHVGFTLVSFDTKRDTPAALAEYRSLHNLPAERWTLLHGGPDDVLELAALLGVKFKQDARGDFAHSNVITILNSQGEIVHQQIGFNQDVSETVRVIERLVAQ